MRARPREGAAHPPPREGSAPASSVGLRPSFGPYRILVFTLLLFVVGRLHQAIPILAKGRPVLLFFVAAVGYGVLKRKALELDTLFRYWPAKLMVALFVFACISAPFGLSLGGSAYFILTHYLRLIMIAFLVIAGIGRTEDLYLFVWSYVVSTGILVFFALFYFKLRAVGGGVMRLDNMFSYDSNDMGVLLATTIPLTALVWQSATSRWGKIAAGAILVGTGAALARSGSRGAFVGLVVVGTVMVLTLRHIPVAKRVAFVGVIVAALAIATPQGYWERIATLGEPTSLHNWDKYYGRRQLAERAFSYMFRFPVFGVGIDNFRRADATLPAQSSLPGHRRYLAPHNSYAQIGSELGIPGLIMWSSLLLGGIIGLSRLRRRLPYAWVRGDPEERFLYLASMYLPISLIGFAVTSFFLSFAYLEPVYLLAALMSGLYLSVNRKLAREAAVPEAAARPGRLRRAAGRQPLPAARGSTRALG